MTEYNAIPIPPPSLGEVLASPAAYAEAANVGQTLLAPVFASVPVPRGRIRRRVAALAAMVATAGLTLAGCAAPARAAARPVWDGRGVYASGVQPLCPSGLAGHTARAGAPGHRFTATCVVVGREFVWEAVGPVSVGSTRVSAPGAETVTAVFPGCVYDVQAYALRGPVDDDYSAASGVHRGAVKAGHTVRLAIGFAGSDAGRWGHVEVVGVPCGAADPAVSGDWSDLVTVGTSATFTVVAK